MPTYSNNKLNVILTSTQKFGGKCSTSLPLPHKVDDLTELCIDLNKIEGDVLKCPWRPQFGLKIFYGQETLQHALFNYLGVCHVFLLGENCRISPVSECHARIGCAMIACQATDTQDDCGIVVGA